MQTAIDFKGVYGFGSLDNAYLHPFIGASYVDDYDPFFPRM